MIEPLSRVLANWDHVLLWSLLSTIVMTIILHGSQGAGLSRLSLSFLAGTWLTADRGWANVLGFVAYTLGGWLFGIIYVMAFVSFGGGSWWLGGALGVIHGLFLLAVVLPLLPYLHPRMATEYDGPTEMRRLEPPGFLGLNYGSRTPLTTLAAQTVYGIILGACFQMSSDEMWAHNTTEREPAAVTSQHSLI